MKRIHVIHFFVLLTCNSLLTAQIKNIGLPFNKNYDKQTYNAGTQNWDITQDDRGFMFFANNDGILEFDGSSLANL